MKYDLSVIIPSIRVNNLEKILFFLEKGVEPFSFEVIVVSPYDIPDSLKQKENIKWIKDFGSPSRCVQMGSTLAEGKYLCWCSDDCTFIAPQALSQCIQMFEDKKITNKNCICLRYFEGEGNSEFPENYWTARTHPDQQLIGISDGFKCAPLGMYNTEYFRELGGLDCRYLHINLCTHDLAFRLQNAGGRVYLSPQNIFRFYWSWITPDAKPIQDAYFKNDKDLFANEWNKDQSNRIKINYYNWIETESKWKMRWEK